MTKKAAFGTIFKTGTRQVETATVVGTITQSGNATVTTTSTGMVGSPLATSVAVLINDTADMVAEKIRVALRLVAVIAERFSINGSGPQIVLTSVSALANDTALNVSTANDTSLGLTIEATSANTIAGVAFAAVGKITNIGGPGLVTDVDDVTTHDSLSGFEEVVATVLRSGEISLDVEFDPGDTSQNYSTDGLGDRYETKKATACQLTFPGPFTWTFDAFVTGFEPSSPSAGSLIATIKLKVNGVPTLV